MINQVLSREQMQEFIELGIDVSKASMYISEYGEVISNVKIVELDTDWTPTFTLQDILKMLPSVLGTCTYLEIKFALGKIAYRHPLDCEDVVNFEREDDNMLEAAFNMAKWCKQNGHI